MKIQYMSDLHLEYSDNREYFERNPVIPVGDVLVLAGDIVSEYYRKEAKDFFKDVESKFKLVISTMGNHEFYFGEIDYAYPSYENYFSDNHVILNNKTIIFENTKFIVSAFWSKIDPAHEYEIFRRLQDYRHIKKEKNGNLNDLTVKDINEYYQISKDFVFQELEKEFDGNIVVVSHHVPSHNCIIPKWRNSTLISAFANNLDNEISNVKNLDCWIFGHQHEYFEEEFLNTKFVSNPLGYSHENNFYEFKSDRFVSL